MNRHFTSDFKTLLLNLDVRNVSRTAGAGVAASLFLGSGCAALADNSEAQKPNILFILADDLGWSDVGFNGASYYETPHIDRLASQGMQFREAYASAPICTPTRASVMSGKNPARLKITNAALPEQFIPKDRKLLEGLTHQHLPLEEKTVAQWLKENGYATGHIGKWHLGGEGFLPTEQGFDSNVGGSHWGQPASYFFPYNQNQKTKHIAKGMFPNLDGGAEGEYLTDRIANEAIRFLEQQHEKPFFLNLNFYQVHYPHQAKAEKIAKYEGKTPDRDNTKPVYAAMIESLDENIGKIMQRLDELGLTENTLVIFTSDNGGCFNNTPLKGKKGQLYEGGIREPLVFRWPGKIRPGTVCDVPVISCDFLPTFLAVTGQASSEDLDIDGCDLTPLLYGTDHHSLDREVLYWHFPHYNMWMSHIEPASAVRQGDWKLIYFWERDSYELYNLAKDMGEKDNLAERLPEKANDLKTLLHQWLEETKAERPSLNPDYVAK